MTLFDTHAHYYDEKFGSDSERREVIGKIRQAGVKYVINAGTNPDSSRLSLALADEYDGFYAAVGLHPEDIFDISDPEAAFSEIRELAASEKAVAVGEIGLDYHWHGEPSEREFQKYWFSRQLELACELGYPVVVHDRNAHGDCLETVMKFPEARGVFHSFSGSPETARELIKLGWHISFSGVITFENARRTAQIVTEIPEDRLLIETDCPYLTPHPYRGRRNDSSYMLLTAEKAAELRGISVERLCSVTLENAARLFHRTGILPSSINEVTAS